VYLGLCVDPVAGRLAWEWLASMHHTEIALAVSTWANTGIDLVVWDNASSHGHDVVRDVGLPLIGLPPYAPELNPAERVFEALRAELKGRMFPRLEEKVLFIENTLRRWQANPAKLQQLTGRQWILDAIEAATATRGAMLAA